MSEKTEVFEIMELLAKHPVDGVGVTDLTGRLSSSKGTVHRRLQLLVDVGWAEENAHHRYVPSSRFGALAESIRKGLIARGDMIARRLEEMNSVAQPPSAAD